MHLSVNATGAWKKDGSPDATVRPATLVLVFESIDPDEGTARLKFGSVGSDIVVRLSGGYLHFIQSFRSGSLCTTTVFDQENHWGQTPGGTLATRKCRRSTAWRGVESGTVLRRMRGDGLVVLEGFDQGSGSLDVAAVLLGVGCETQVFPKLLG
jgi:hypothetical protein